MLRGLTAHIQVLGLSSAPKLDDTLPSLIPNIEQPHIPDLHRHLHAPACTHPYHASNWKSVDVSDMCAHEYVYIGMCMWIYMCLCMCVFLNMFSVCMWVWTCVYRFVLVCVTGCMCVHMLVGMNLRMGASASVCSNEIRIHKIGCTQKSWDLSHFHSVRKTEAKRVSQSWSKVLCRREHFTGRAFHRGKEGGYRHWVIPHEGRQN